MPLYACTQCGVVDNTALGEYWVQEMNAHKAGELFAPLCSQCFTGEWHDKFPRTDASVSYVPDGKFLKHKSEML